MGMFAPIGWSKRPATWLRITAIFEIVLAAVFAFIGFRSPLLREGFYLTAAILGGVGLLILLWANRMRRGYEEAQRIRTQGIAGQGRVVNMRQTGAYLNEQPQVELTLEVTTPMHGAYQTTLKEWIPLIMLGRLTSGAPLPVKVDPNNQQRVVIEWDSAGSAMPGAQAGAGFSGMPMAAGMGAAPTDTASPAETKARLLASGVAGSAKVLKARRTDEVDGDGRPVYDLELEIQVQGMPPMRGPARVGIPPERVDRLEEGDTVPIKADPSNPAMMAVDWDSA
jgi:hypothetical protein